MQRIAPGMAIAKWATQAILRSERRHVLSEGDCPMISKREATSSADDEKDTPRPVPSPSS